MLAGADRMSQWTRAMDDNGWRQKADGIEARAERHADMASAGELPKAFRRPSAPVAPRPIDVLVENALKTFDQVSRADERPSPDVTGQGGDSSGKVVVTLSGAALTACEIEPAWARRQNAESLARALEEAASAARRALFHAEPEQPSPKETLNTIFDEAIATLHDLESPGPS
jgi:hypothetical protein